LTDDKWDTRAVLKRIQDSRAENDDRRAAGGRKIELDREYSIPDLFVVRGGNAGGGTSASLHRISENSNELSPEPSCRAKLESSASRWKVKDAAVFVGNRPLCGNCFDETTARLWEAGILTGRTE